MQSNYSSVYFRFKNAVESLATGEGDVRERLVAAFMTIAPINVQDLPEELRADFEWVKNQLTKHEPEIKGEGKIHATVRHIYKKTGSRIARRIVDIKNQLEQYTDR